MAKTTTSTGAKEKKKYSYVVKGPDGKVREGAITASSTDALTREFARRGYVLLDEPQEVATGGLNMELNIGGKKRVKPKEVALFARKASSMLDAGIPIKKVISVLANAEGMNPTLSGILHDIESDLIQGLSFSEALAKHDVVFSPLMISMVKAGESGGFMEKSMRQVAENLEKDVRLAGKIKSAMTYPVVVLILALVMSAAMLIFIVPVFDEMFKSLGSQLPLPTQILVWLSDFMKVAIGPIAVIVVIALAWWRKNKNKTSVRQVKDPLLLKVPIAGKLVKKIVLSRFSRNLSTLLDNGVPILTALAITGGTTGSIVVEDILEDVSAGLKRGEELPESMRRHEFFPTPDIEMIAVGQESGDISTMLGKVADIYDEEVEQTTEALTSLIEPLMIVFLGILVGSMIIALYLPIFGAADAVMGAG